MDCWATVEALEGKTLRTLARTRLFRVVLADEDQVLLESSRGKKRSIQRREIEGAYRELAEEGQLDLEGIGQRHSKRGMSYVAAILAECEGVQVEVKPAIRLSYSAPQAGSGKGPAGTGAAPLSATSATVLQRIAEGRTYEQILALHPELTYRDIFAAAQEALDAAGQ